MLTLYRDGHKYLLHTRTDFGTVAVEASGELSMSCSLWVQDGGWREIRGHRTELLEGASSVLDPEGSEFSVAREWYLDLEGKVRILFSRISSSAPRFTVYVYMYM